MADGVSNVSQQSLSEIFGKIDKAAEQGREVFVNDQGDVRTKGQFKSFFIRHFQPGFQAQQSEKIAQAIANAANRGGEDARTLSDRKVATLKAGTLSGIHEGTLTSSTSKASPHFRLNTVNVLNRANELATTAANKNFTTDITTGKTGTHNLSSSHTTLAKIEDSLGTLGNDFQVWEQGSRNGPGYVPANDKELPAQFVNDIPRQTTVVGGEKTFERSSNENTPENVQKALQNLAKRAGAREDGQASKAAQALTTVLNQALFSSSLPIQEKSSYGTEGRDWVSLVTSGSDHYVFKAELSEDGNIHIEAEQDSTVKAVNLFNDNGIEPLLEPGEELASHVSASFDVSAEALFGGEVSVIPGSLNLTRSVTVP